MAKSSDDEMDHILCLADEMSTDFANALGEIETLKSNLNAEIKNRQALELTCSTLTRENDRLKNLQSQTLTNLTVELDRLENPHDLRQELKKLTEESLRKEEEHLRVIESLNQNHNEKLGVLEDQIKGILSQKAADESAIYQLHHELISHRNRLKDMESKYQGEIEDLKDCIFAEQQEKKELSKNVSDLEKELLVTRTKMADLHVSSSDKQLDALKQKMMKLRKENQVLKQQLIASKEHSQG